MNALSRKWLAVVGVLFVLALVAYFYPLMKVLAPSGMSMEFLSDVDGLEVGTETELRFVILDEEGQTLKDFEIAHERLLHLILVRDDLQHFQHLHPSLNSSTGEFSARMTLSEAGDYTMFGDFVPLKGERTVLSVPLSVTGEYLATPLVMSSERSVIVGPFMVTPHFPEVIRSGEAAHYSFDVTKNGKAIQLEKYLGATGHSVLLHEVDLDFIHTHADESALAFSTVFAKTGLYKAFTQFQVDGQVYTVDTVFKVVEGVEMAPGSDAMDMSGH